MASLLVGLVELGFPGANVFERGCGPSLRGPYVGRGVAGKELHISAVINEV